MGYSEEMIAFRKEHFHENDDILTSRITKSGIIKTVGSKGEGIVRYFESDTDVLDIYSDIVCVEETLLSEEYLQYAGVFIMNDLDSNPGYCSLSLQKYSGSMFVINGALCPHADRSYLSSKKYKDICVAAYKEKVSKDTVPTGPAVTATLPFSRDNDQVHTLRCFCPTILQQWAQRPRYADWPPAGVRDAVLLMGGNVVPTGIKGHEMESFQWRLCFNEIEVLLVENLNDTQTKLFKMLKMIKSNILSTTERKITSYILKNVVLWLAEENPQSEFHKENLFSWVIKALEKLRRAVKDYSLPYYLIPDRNLLAEKLEIQDKERVIENLNDVIHMGPKMLFGLEKIKLALEMTPEELQEFWEKRDKYEKLYLAFCNLISSELTPEREALGRQASDVLDIALVSKWPKVIKSKIKLEQKDWECILLT